MSAAYAGTARLLWFALRRDRAQVPIWIVGSAVLLAVGAAAVADEFPTENERLTALQGAGGSPAVLMLRGAPVGTSLGAMVSFRNFAFLLLLAALMSTFAVVRHTRRDEETGRTEMVGACAVGRHSALAAALLVTLVANLLLGAALTATLLVTADVPAAGSLAFGAAVATTGMAFAGLAAVAAQLFTSARAANASAATAIGAAFLIRGCGDALGERSADGVRVTSGWPSWLSPIGWGTLVRPYGGERWWLLAIPVALLLVTAGAAFALVDRRDLGAGLIPDRPGPARAAAGLLSPLGLAWRLHRGTVVGWVLGATVFGVVVGSLGKAAGEAFADNTNVADLMNQLAGASGRVDLVDAYYAAMMNVLGALAAAFMIQVTLRLRSEEVGGLAEASLATALSRIRWAGAHLACAVVGAGVMLLFAGLGAGVADAAVGGSEDVGTLVSAGLVQSSAALVVAGFVVFAFGGLPRLVVGLAWTGLAVSLACGLLGDVIGLPQAARDVSPFSHVPAIPAADPALGPIVALLLVAAALVVAGLTFFRRRDLVP